VSDLEATVASLRGDLAKALREELAFLSPSFSDMLVEKRPLSDELEPGTLNRFYRAGWHVYEGGEYRYAPFIDLTEVWDWASLRIPENRYALVIYARMPVRYGFVVDRLKLPDLAGQGYDHGSGMLFSGFWLAEFEKAFAAMKWAHDYRDGAWSNQLAVSIGGAGYADRAFWMTSSLPADYLTAKHYYWCKVNRHQIWFGVDGRIRGFVLLAGEGAGVDRVKDDKLPYSVAIWRGYVPTTMPAAIEVDVKKGGLPAPITLEWGFHDHNWCEGDPCPPLSMPLYVEDSEATLAGQTISSGSLTSHPIPIFGYDKKTILFQAIQAGTLTIQVYTLAGNWRTYDSVPVSANTLLHYIMSGDALLAKVIFTPSTYPAKVNNAEVMLNTE
jgi:hypothetical protein